MANHITSREFLIGATVGGLLGTVTALMIAPKSGKRLRQDIYDTCCDIKEKTEDMASDLTKKSKTLARKANTCGCSLTDKAKCLVHDVVEWVSPSEEEFIDKDNTKDLVLGSIAGAVIGAAAGLLLAPKSGAELREDIVDTYNDVSERTQEAAERVTKKGQAAAKSIRNQTSDWLSLAQDVIDELTDRAQETGEEVVEKGRKALNQNKINNIMDWASLGMQVWQHLKKRG